MSFCNDGCVARTRMQVAGIADRPARGTIDRARGACARVVDAREGDTGCGEILCALWTVARARSIGVARRRRAFEIFIVDRARARPGASGNE